MKGFLLTLYGSGTGVIDLISEWFNSSKNIIAPGKGNSVKIWSIDVSGSDPVQIQVTDDYTVSSPTWNTVLEIPAGTSKELKLPLKILTARTGKEAFRVNVNGTTGSNVTLLVEITPA